MGILKPVLMLVILSSVMVCSNAWATEPPPRVGATRDQAQPAPDVAKKKPIKRRAVRQVLDDAPAAYGPRLNRPPRAAAPPSPPPSLAAPASPLILNGCNGGACTDADGAHYQGGVGTTLLSPQGRVCSNNGITVQCF